jgi:hypothetical protein
MHTNLDGMINCMAHNNICAMHTANSQVTRCSEDYKKGDLWRAKHHLNNSYHNMLWLGQTVWGDHDMFHSSDGSAAVFANSKAISGGPIYLSDLPGKIDAALVRRLCFEDGRLLRPLAPAVPTPESLFCNTYEGDAAYVVMAPLPNRDAAFIAYNLTHPEKLLRGTLPASDYCFAPGMMQSGVPQWDFPVEGLLCYDPLRATAQRLGPDDSVPLSLPHFGDVLYLMIPITHGWAVIGRRDKILSPCALGEVSLSPEKAVVRMLEQGPLLIWSATSPLRIEVRGPEGAVPVDAMTNLGAGLWEAALAVEAGVVEVSVYR